MRPASGERDLLELLETELADAMREAGGDGKVAAEVWQRALVAPAREFLGRPGKQFRARLVRLAHALCCGEGDAAQLSPLLPALVELVHAGSLIVDDIEDGARHRRGERTLHRICGTPLAINTGNWLYFAAYHLIGRAGLDGAATHELYTRLTRTMLRSHQGQALDLGADVTATPQRELAAMIDTAAALKSGELMRFAAELGAIAAHAPAPAVDALSRFGASLGIGLQRLDDLDGIRDPRRRDKAREDLAGRRPTWVWACLAGALDEPRFAALQRVAAGAVHARPEALDAFAAELAELLGDGARVRACRELAVALDRLATTFPGHPALREVEAELARLERRRG